MKLSAHNARPVSALGTLRKTRRQRQQERRQTKGLMSKTMAVHVHYNSWYISLPSSARQQREMTEFCVVCRTWSKSANFAYFYLEFNAFVAYSAGQVLIPTDTLDRSKEMRNSKVK